MKIDSYLSFFTRLKSKWMIWCKKTFSGEILHTFLITPYRKHMTVKSTLANQRVFWFTYRNTGDRLHIRAETAQRQLYHQSPPQHACQLTKAGNMECTAQLTGSSASWRVPFPRNLVTWFFYTSYM